MSDARTRRLAAIACAAALVAPVVLRAQAEGRRSVAERYAAAQHRLDSIDAQLKALKAAADNAVPPLVLSEGLLHVRYDASVGPRTLAALRDAMRQATAHIIAVQGDAAAGTIGRAEFIAHESVYPGSTVRLLQIQGRGPSANHWLQVGTPPRVASIAALFEGEAASLASSRLPPAGLGAGIHSTIPAAPLTADAWTDIAIWTATSTSTVARRCLGGSVSDCRRLVEDAPNGTLEAWYDPADYPAIVERHDWRPDSLRQRELAQRCIERREMGACSEAAHLMNPPYPVPLEAVQQSLRGLALEKGGPKAFTRMLEAPPNDVARLEAAAGVPFDALLAAWQSRIAAARPRHGVIGIVVATFWFATLVFIFSRRRPTCA